MTRILALVVLSLLAPLTLADGMVEKPSQHSVSVTLDRLTGIVTEKGFSVVARVDHAAAAKRAGLTLLPTELLIFGNPKVGTQLMQSQRTVGLDLPIKVLVWEDPEGNVWLAYTAPDYLLARHGIDDREAVREKMTQALDGFTNAATGP